MGYRIVSAKRYVTPTQTHLISILLALFTLACVAALWISPAGLLPQQAVAQTRWRAQGIHHYRMTARLTEGWIESGPWTVEIRDDKVLGGYDTASGVPLDGVRVRQAQRFLPIGRLFAAIENAQFTPTFRSPRTLVARLVPSLRDSFDHCAARMPLVAYHPALGYPSGVSVFASPCYPGGNWSVLVTELTPLP